MRGIALIDAAGIDAPRFASRPPQKWRPSLSLVVFLVLTAAPQAGFGNYFLPLQIGAREMAFPELNRLSFWATAASLLGLTVAFLAPPESGITLWIVSVAVFCAASLLNGLNFSVTKIGRAHV